VKIGTILTIGTIIWICVNLAFSYKSDMKNKQTNKQNSLGIRGLFISVVMLESMFLFIYCFTSRLRMYHLFGDVTIAGEELQNLGLYSAQRESLSYYTCCNTGSLIFFRSHPKDRPIQSPFAIHKGMWRIYSNPDPHG
jgi:hypothetical protein